MRLLDPLERRIVGALQMDERVSWRRMAEVLGEPERTVTRRGTELLESGVVQVTGLRPPTATVIVGIQSAAGTIRTTANAMAARPDCTFSYTLTGSMDCVAEIATQADRMPSLLMDEIPGTMGLVRAVSYPIMRYFRTIRSWQPSLLTEPEAAALRSDRETEIVQLETFPELNAVDNRIVDALCQDGRMTYERLARMAGVSDATARRRAEWLLRHDRVHLRAVVEPAVLGLPVEALLWIRTDPQNVDVVGRQVASSPLVRYAAAVAGDYQIVADVTARDPAALYSAVTQAPWAANASSVDTTLVLNAIKRGGRTTGQGR
ncbi:Lrp/AsnC family transcriptional regulator [Arthrobacter pigmenti]